MMLAHDIPLRFTVPCLSLSNKQVVKILWYRLIYFWSFQLVFQSPTFQKLCSINSLENKFGFPTKAQGLWNKILQFKKKVLVFSFWEKSSNKGQQKTCMIKCQYLQEYPYYTHVSKSNLEIFVIWRSRNSVIIHSAPLRTIIPSI